MKLVNSFCLVCKIFPQWDGTLLCEETFQIKILINWTSYPLCLHSVIFLGRFRAKWRFGQTESDVFVQQIKNLSKSSYQREKTKQETEHGDQMRMSNLVSLLSTS